MNALLTSGVLVGPVFYIIVTGQILLRPGFNILRHPISVLSLGDLGWIQVLNFLATGALAIAFAVGVFLKRQDGTTATAAVLCALFGVGIIVAGLFSTDPSLGFPPGTPETGAMPMSQSAQFHAFGFMVAFSALTLALVAFCVMYWGVDRVFAIVTLGAALAVPAIIVFGMSATSRTSLSFFVLGIVGMGWLSITAWRLLSELQ